MNNWFEVKVKMDKVQEDGMSKRVSEVYLFDAMTFTEGESKAVDMLAPYVNGEFEIDDISKRKYSEVVVSTKTEDEKWWRVKVLFITLDEKTGTEKGVSNIFLMQAKDLRTALDYVEETMKSSMIDYTVTEVKETAYIDVFFHSDTENNED